MAPEGVLPVPRSAQARRSPPFAVIQNNQQGYSAKADIWSLGCLCLEMFAGRRPWDKKEVFETMFKVRRAPRCLTTPSLTPFPPHKLGAERLAPPVPEDVILSELAKAFFSACFQGCVPVLPGCFAAGANSLPPFSDPDMRPRADQLMRHRFLELSPDYAFTKTTLYRYVSAVCARKSALELTIRSSTVPSLPRATMSTPRHPNLSMPILSSLVFSLIATIMTPPCMNTPVILRVPAVNEQCRSSFREAQFSERDVV